MLPYKSKLSSLVIVQLSYILIICNLLVRCTCSRSLPSQRCTKVSRKTFEMVFHHSTGRNRDNSLDQQLSRFLDILHLQVINIIKFEENV